MITVYLAGGMKSGWQDKVIEVCGNEYFEWIDPRDHGLTDEAEYTKWDLDGIDSCDVVFAYLEHDNPGGYALALEIGYAKARGKKIIFVEGLPTIRGRYFGMARQCANYATHDLMAGYAYLLGMSEGQWM